MASQQIFPRRRNKVQNPKPVEPGLQTRKILVSFRGTMLEQIDTLAREEHRTRSELIREALRRYIDTSLSKRVKLNQQRIGEVLEHVLVPD